MTKQHVPTTLPFTAIPRPRTLLTRSVAAVMSRDRQRVLDTC